MIVTIRHPNFGTLDLHDATIEDGYVTGEVWNNHPPTSGGVLEETMSFPVSCIVAAGVEWV